MTEIFQEVEEKFAKLIAAQHDLNDALDKLNDSAASLLETIRNQHGLNHRSTETE